MNINLTMIGQLMMFAMFTWFCMKFVWPPIVAAMEERKKRIESGARYALAEILAQFPRVLAF
jgi:F-type H+-transporting ATPase subunit b